MSTPTPVRTDSPDVWPKVTDDVLRGQGCASLPLYWRQRLAERMERRDEFGRAKYGVPLRVDNGRDALRDCLEEALDGCAYSRQQYEQTRHPDDWETHTLFVALAARVLWRLEMRGEESKVTPGPGGVDQS